MWFILRAYCHILLYIHVRDIRLSSFTYSDESSRFQRPSKMRHAITLRQFRQWWDAIEKRAEISFTNTKVFSGWSIFVSMFLTARNVSRENSYDSRKYLGRRNLSAIFLSRVANTNRPSRYTLRTAKLTACETINTHPSHLASLAFCHNLRHFSYNSTHQINLFSEEQQSVALRPWWMTIECPTKVFRRLETLLLSMESVWNPISKCTCDSAEKDDRLRRID